MTRLFVAADDRTGALETAGMCADAACGEAVAGSAAALAGIGPADLLGYETVVVDVGSRHLAPSVAAVRAAHTAGLVTAERLAYKIDSTLRGNWAVELVARWRGSGQRILLVPAFPDVGRTCVDGVVLEHGRPVAAGHAGTDPLAPIHSSRPAEHLVLAGAPAVAYCADSVATEAWLRGSGEPFAVCDATTHNDLAAIGRMWAAFGRDVLLAGTAAAIAAGARALDGNVTDNNIDEHRDEPLDEPLDEHPERSVDRLFVGPALDGPASVGPGGHVRRVGGRWHRQGAALVICGSLNAVSRRQVEELVANGAVAAVIDFDQPAGAVPPDADLRLVIAALHGGGIAVLTTTDSRQRNGSGASAVDRLVDGTAHARRLGRLGWELAESQRVQTIVVIGGDTAEAVIGDRAVVVSGTVAAGAPLSAFHGSATPAIITKAGGFGHPLTLVELLDHLPRPSAVSAANSPVAPGPIDATLMRWQEQRDSDTTYAPKEMS